MRANFPALFVSSSLSAYVLILGWFAYSYLGGSIDSGFFFNADALYLPSLFKNIFLEGKHISDWILAPSSLIFPDALLYALAYFTSKDAVTQILVFAILQSIVFFLLTCIFLDFFLRRSDAVAYAALISSNIIVLGLYSAEPFGLSLISVFHFGSLISYLLLSVLLLKFLTTTTSRLKYFVGFLTVCFTALSVISDHLIGLHFVAPVLLICIYFYFVKSKYKEIWQFGILLFTGFLVAFVLEKILIPHTGQLDYEVGFGSLVQKSLLLANWAFERPWLIQASLLLLPIALLNAVVFLAKNRNNTEPRIARRKLFALVFIASTVATLLVTGLSNRGFTVRYLLPYLFLPPLFLFILLNENKAKLLAAAMFCLSLLTLTSAHQKETTSGQLYPDVVRCVDGLAQKHHVSRGIAQYWDAIPIYVFSDTGLSVVPVLSDGSPTRWMFNTSEYAGKFSFAIINNSASDFYRISREAIERRLKKKPFEYQCFDRTVLIFDNESITLPQQTEVSNIRSSALESFIENPRALLIMAQEEAEKGNQEASARLLSEAIALLKRSGARAETIKYYESLETQHQP